MFFNPIPQDKQTNPFTLTIVSYPVTVGLPIANELVMKHNVNNNKTKLFFIKLFNQMLNEFTLR